MPKTLILIDGNHRIVKATVDGQPFEIYVLTEEEELACRWTQAGETREEMEQKIRAEVDALVAKGEVCLNR